MFDGQGLCADWEVVLQATGPGRENTGQQVSECFIVSVQNKL